MPPAIKNETVPPVSESEALAAALAELATLKAAQAARDVADPPPKGAEIVGESDPALVAFAKKSKAKLVSRMPGVIIDKVMIEGTIRETY